MNRTSIKKWERRAVHWMAALSRLGYRPRKKPSNKVLFVKSCCFGDAVLSLYAVRAFAKKYPEVEMDILCTRRVSEIYQHCGYFKNVFALSPTGLNLAREVFQWAFWSGLFRILLALKRRQYGELMDLELYREYPMILKYGLNIPRSRGFMLPRAARKAHDHQVYRGVDAPEWQCFYQLLLPREEIPPTPDPLFPKNTAAPIPVNALDTTRPVNQTAKRTTPATGGSRKKILGLVYGASPNWPQKKWPLRYFGQVLQALEPDLERVILFGAADEKPDAHLLEQFYPQRVENTAGQLNYRTLIPKLQECDLVLGNDTGTMHLAAACGVPTFTLFGPTNPLKWKPMGGHALHLENLPCRPCYYLSHMPACSHVSCLHALRPGPVSKSVRDILNSEVMTDQTFI